MHRFISNFPLDAGKEILLDEKESHHLAKVLRLEVGAEVVLIDGKGSVAAAVLTQVKPKQSVAKVLSVEKTGKPSNVTLCFGIPKGQALDFVFRRAPELGVCGLQPLQTRHSTTLKGWNPDRWQNVVEEVCKQCESSYFPEVHLPQTLSGWLATREKSRLLVFCDENVRQSNFDSASLGVDLLVGAEGGFSREEAEQVKGAGASFLGLGAHRLRAETASLVALTLVKARLGEI
jgi:16S rRNA (uracil1498-N3)-methyltransferase